MMMTRHPEIRFRFTRLRITGHRWQENFIYGPNMLKINTQIIMREV
jgi:hypothetical protein